MEGTDFMNFKVSIPQDEIKGGEQSGGPSAILPAQLGLQEGQSGCPYKPREMELAVEQRPPHQRRCFCTAPWSHMGWEELPLEITDTAWAPLL